jgi:hypothetical protein
VPLHALHLNLSTTSCVAKAFGMCSFELGISIRDVKSRQGSIYIHNPGLCAVFSRMKAAVDSILWVLKLLGLNCWIKLLLYISLIPSLTFCAKHPKKILLKQFVQSWSICPKYAHQRMTVPFHAGHTTYTKAGH